MNYFINHIIFGVRNLSQLNELINLYKKKNTTNFQKLKIRIKENHKLFLKKGY